jgi:site-specific DNA recombinase
MEGSHQKHANWYRCQYARRRGIAAADAAGHPRSLGIKEEVVLDALRDFLVERLFGPDRLRLLSEELAASTGDDSASRDAELERLRAESEKLDKALYRQSLRLEEQDDPDHPIVKLATQRIEELNGQAEAIALTVGDLEKQRPAGPSPAEVKAALDAVPDLSKALENASEDELTELLDAFDVSVSYDKPAKRLELSAVIAPDLDPETAGGRSGDSFIAGAGFEPATFGL